MNRLRQRVFKWVSGTHLAVLVLLLVIPSVRGCFRKEPKIVATFDLGLPPPPEIEPDPEPAPEIKPLPKPEKKPDPKPALTNIPPKKAETNTPPKKAEEKKPAATNPVPKKAETKKAETNTPPKPKTLEERLKEVRKGGKPAAKTSAKTAPQLDLSGLKSALNSAAGSGTYGSGSGSGSGVYSPFAGYYDSVKQRMYSVWKQPAGAPIGLTATASIRVERDGTVSRKTLTGRSGNMQFDQSVQSALDATVRLPVPPPDLPSRDIEIEFVLAD